MTSKGPFRPKAFSDSVILLCTVPSTTQNKDTEIPEVFWERKVYGEITPHHQLFLASSSSVAVRKRVMAHNNFQSLVGSMNMSYVCFYEMFTNETFILLTEYCIQHLYNFEVV